MTDGDVGMQVRETSVGPGSRNACRGGGRAPWPCSAARCRVLQACARPQLARGPAEARLRVRARACQRTPPSLPV